jgi:hypothetical protein
MGSHQQLFLRLLFFVIALVTVVGLSASQATGAKTRNRADCTWGASSMRAQIVGGKIVSSAPSTSGCIPR